MYIFRKTKNFVTAISLISFLTAPPVGFAQESAIKAPSKYNLKELALPSEVQGLSKQTGAIFYSPAIKDKVLIPVHFWGEIGKTGLHYIPVGTNLISGISLAGGPRGSAKLTDIRLTRREDKLLSSKEFNLSGGGSTSAYQEVLQPGDTIFVKKSSFQIDRAYYTGLAGVIATVLSSILLYRQVKN